MLKPKSAYRLITENKEALNLVLDALKNTETPQRDIAIKVRKIIPQLKPLEIDSVYGAVLQINKKFGEKGKPVRPREVTRKIWRKYAQTIFPVKPKKKRTPRL